MSAVVFFTPAYTANFQSIRGTVQNFVEGYFDLASRPLLATALKITSCVTLVISAAVLAIKAYLRCSGHREIAPASFCEKHPEFSGLLQKAQNIVAVENFNPKQLTAISTREIYVGNDTHRRNKLFIKSPVGRFMFPRQQQAKNEQLAFLISHRLNLGIVPPTMALEGYKDEIESIFPASMSKHLKIGCDPKTHENSYDGVTVQEGVLLKQNQGDLDTLDLEQVQKSVIFNLITGRDDAGQHNTIIAQSGKIMELDNEILGQLLSSSSWLLSEFSEMTFSPQVINTFLSKPSDTVRCIFKEMQAFNFDPRTEKNITINFDKIRKFFTMRSGVQIKVKDLIALQILNEKT